MKASDGFKKTIKAYLDNRAKEDELFAETYAKPNKNIEDCITYILNSVQKSGCNGFDDDEIYSMAVHYYDEDNIDVGKPVNAKVVVNHKTENKRDEDDNKAAKPTSEDKTVSTKKRTSKQKKEDVGQLVLF
ncbi:PcfK-like protein [Paludibacter sp. 221]|uniref:PcfK-like family protein n=1 Tax=Paludibacter sp. 221 TaxID=2302939 RepID=UPI0013D1E01C|nr:PcfK-like family protein [Paludibacter sp. 221]NDV46127.1 PcfK-like protein [Paludibacter sp. 221]